jgi:signal peptidase I
MEDTLLVGDYLLVDKFTYGIAIPFTRWRLPALSAPQPGDVVVFRSPVDPQRVYVKRCVATAGQRVEIRNKVVYVDGRRAIDPPFSKYVDASILPGKTDPRDNYGPHQVPEGAVFLLGDNRDNSRDSRHWGALPREAVVGRAICLYWSCKPPHEARGNGWTKAFNRLLTLPERIRWSRLGYQID